MLPHYLKEILLLYEQDVLVFIEDCFLESASKLASLDADGKNFVRNRVADLFLQEFSQNI